MRLSGYRLSKVSSETGVQRDDVSMGTGDEQFWSMNLRFESFAERGKFVESMMRSMLLESSGVISAWGERKDFSS